MSKKKETTRRRGSPLQFWTLLIVLLLIVGQFVSASLVSFFWKDSGLKPIEEEVDDMEGAFAELEIDEASRAQGAQELSVDEPAPSTGEETTLEDFPFDPDRVDPINRTPNEIEEMLAREEKMKQQIAKFKPPTFRQLTSAEQILAELSGEDPAAALAVAPPQITWPGAGVASVSEGADGRQRMVMPSLTGGRPFSIRVPVGTPGVPPPVESAQAVEAYPPASDPGFALAGIPLPPPISPAPSEPLAGVVLDGFSTLETRMETAAEFARDGRFEPAVAAYKNIQIDHPDHFEAYAALAQIHEERQDFTAALTEWEEGIAVAQRLRVDDPTADVLYDVALERRNQLLDRRMPTLAAVESNPPFVESVPQSLPRVIETAPSVYRESTPSVSEPPPRVRVSPRSIDPEIIPSSPGGGDSFPRSTTQPTYTPPPAAPPSRSVDQAPRVRTRPVVPSVAATPEPQSTVPTPLRPFPTRAEPVRPDVVERSAPPPPRPAPEPAAPAKVVEIVDAGLGTKFGKDLNYEEIRMIPVTIRALPGRHLNTSNVSVRYAFYDRDRSSGEYVLSRAEPMKLTFSQTPGRREINMILAYKLKAGQRFMQSRTLGRNLAFGGFYAEVYYNGLKQGTVIRPPGLVSHTSRTPPRLEVATP